MTLAPPRYQAALADFAAALRTLQRPTERLLYICPHIRADGDALGSALGLAHWCDRVGIRTRILLSEAPPEMFDYLRALRQARVVGEDEVAAIIAGPPYDVLMIDCSDAARLGVREPLFTHADPAARYVLDHHISAMTPSAQVLIRTDAAATCELVAHLMHYAETSWDMEMADADAATAVYTGLLTDTGRFTFASTTAHTLTAAAYLLPHGVDTQFLASRLFETMSRAALKLRAALVSRMTWFADDRGVIAVVDRALMDDCGAVPDDLEAIPSWLRTIKGVELAVMVRDQGDGEVRGNLRSLPPLNVQPLAKAFGGGGHAQASGFSVKGGKLQAVRDEAVQLGTALLRDGVVPPRGTGTHDANTPDDAKSAGARPAVTTSDITDGDAGAERSTQREEQP